MSSLNKIVVLGRLPLKVLWGANAAGSGACGSEYCFPSINARLCAKQLAKSSNWDKKDKEVPEMRSLLEKLKLC